VLQAANKADTLWTGMIMLPAIIFMLNAAISYHQGTADKYEVAQAASAVMSKFSAQYTPYVEKTGTMIFSGSVRAAKTLSIQAPRKAGPVYTNPQLSKSTTLKSSLTKPLSTSSFKARKIKPYTAYRSNYRSSNKTWRSSSRRGTGNRVYR
jgi:hypothetical protein